MSNALSNQIPKNLMFRYRIPCRYLENQPQGLFELGADYRLPSLATLEGSPTFADMRIGWRDDGLYMSLKVIGKKQSLWCEETQIHESDGLQVWIDTRATHDVHRATKFCHWMIFLPTGSSKAKTEKSTKPVGRCLKINRSREVSPAINRAKLMIESELTSDGYRMSVVIPQLALFGWNPKENPTIGFNYAVCDRELGWQTLAIGPQLPMDEDPSLWQTMILVDNIKK